LPEKTDKQAREIINTWVKTGTLVSEDYDDPEDRKVRKGLRVVTAKGGSIAYPGGCSRRAEIVLISAR